MSQRGEGGGGAIGDGGVQKKGKECRTYNFATDKMVGGKDNV